MRRFQSRSVSSSTSETGTAAYDGLRMLRIVAAALLTATLCTACGGATGATSRPRPAAQVFRGFAIKPPVAAPAFRLRDQDGRLVGPAAVRGKWFVVTFLYTHCPDVCPLIADNLAAAQRSLPKLWVLAVSVD